MNMVLGNSHLQNLHVQALAGPPDLPLAFHGNLAFQNAVAKLRNQDHVIRQHGGSVPVFSGFIFRPEVIVLFGFVLGGLHEINYVCGGI